MASDIDFPFPYKDQCKAFDREFIECLGKSLKQEQATMVAAENIQSFKHGMKWQSHNSYAPDAETSMGEQSSEMVISYKDVVEDGPELLARKFNELRESMLRNFYASMFSKVKETCDETGQTASAEGLKMADAMLEGLKKVEFGVGRDGSVSLPQIHLAPDQHKALMEDLESRGDDFHARWGDVVEEKTKAAIEREIERKAKFLSIKEPS